MWLSCLLPVCSGAKVGAKAIIQNCSRTRFRWASFVSPEAVTYPDAVKCVIVAMSPVLLYHLSRITADASWWLEDRSQFHLLRQRRTRKRRRSPSGRSSLRSGRRLRWRRHSSLVFTSAETALPWGVRTYSFPWCTRLIASQALTPPSRNQVFVLSGNGWISPLLGDFTLY